MNVNYGTNPFEFTRQKISTSSEKLKNYITFQIIFGIIAVAIASVIMFVFLGITISELENLNENNIRDFAQNLIDSGLFAATPTLIAAIFLIIVGVIIVIFSILAFVQYYKLGQGFDRLHKIDSTLETSKYISYGFYGYVISVVVGILVGQLWSGMAGQIVSIVGTASLALAAYFIYQLFNEYKKQGRFNRNPSYLLLLGMAAQLISQLTSLFTFYGGIVGVVGFILMLLGFRDLSKEMKLVAPPGGQVVQAQPAKETSYTPTQPATPSQQTGSQFCSHCGAKFSGNEKFCINCGAEV